MTDKSQTEQLFDKVRQGELITLEQPFNFSCRGCGFMCCYNMEISLTPPEYAVILWYLARSPLGKVIQESNIKWADMSLGETTGLPIAGINFKSAEDQSPGYCPFLLPVAVETPQGPRRLNQAWCGLRDARPGACRIYPLGRMLMADAHTDFADPAQWSYFITSRCPGFEPAQAGEDVPPGYTPPNGTLLREWLSQQFNAEQDRLKAFYLQEVIPAYLAAEVHAPVCGGEGHGTEQGIVCPDVMAFLGITLFYAPPPAPEEPAQDYPVLRKWLEYLRDFAPTLKEILSPVDRTPSEQIQALQQYALNHVNKEPPLP
jgi:Fe-S-cluster containining protein